MEFGVPLVEARFVARPNRYVVIAEAAGEEVVAHCADPGRLTELLTPGATIWLSQADTGSVARKTQWDLRLVRDGETGALVSLDTRVPNRLFEEGLRAGFFPQFAGWIELRREVPLPILGTPSAVEVIAEPPVHTRRTPHSRIDFRLRYADDSLHWIEVKSASLVVEREARFPDAVTARGARHLLELAALAHAGTRTSVVFIVQRADVDYLVAHRATDPVFADALDAARFAGVTVYAATCRVTLAGITLAREIPVY